MKLVFRPEAKQELLEAQAWYEARSVGLGLEFARAIEAAVDRVSRTPYAFPRIEGEFRHAITKKFPHSVIYHAGENEVVVVSVYHHRRKPKSWLGRSG